MTRAILHLDMDAFYASVEQRDHPELRGKPLIVGGHPTRGVVLAASYEVRPTGVRSAMPMSRAVRLAPGATVVPPRFHAYVEASERVFSIFESVTPLIEPLSLDEAFLDVTGSTRLLGTPWEIARRLRERISKEVGLPCSAGIAPVKFVAKIASDLAKPNGQREVLASEMVGVLGALPVSRLWGVGPKLEATLHALGLKTIGDLARRDRAWLAQQLGEGTGPHLWDLSHGLDEREVVPDREAKSIGAEDTFEEDLPAGDALHPHLHDQAVRVAKRLRKSRVRTRVVQLKLKLSDFTLVTRRLTLAEPTDDGQALYRTALDLLGRKPVAQRVRLTGVSAQELVAEPPQLSLFTEAPKRNEKLNAALDAIHARFGQKAISTADLAGRFEEDEESDDDALVRHRNSRLDHAGNFQRSGDDNPPKRG